MTAEQLRKSILQLAIQGKLVPQDPNDEPASVLLERIRAEKQRLISEGKIKKGKPDSIIFKGEDNCHYEKVGKDIVCIDEEVADFDIPDSWCLCRMSTIADLYTGNSINETEKQRKYVNLIDGYNYIATKDVSFDHTINYSNGVKIPFVETNFRVAHKNTPLLCIEGGSAGRKIALLEEDVCFGNKLCAFRPIGVNYKYLYYYLQNPLFIQVFKSKTTGIIGGVSVNTLKTLIFALPPFDEQERIVAAIEQFEPLLAEYDRLEKQATKLDKEIYDKLKKSILQYAIQGKLVEQDVNDEPASVLLERIRAEKKAKLGKKYVESYIFKGDDNCYYEKVGSAIKNITDEIPFDIPENWSVCRLKNICSKIVDGDHNPPKGVANITNYLMLSSQNINHDKIVSLDKVRYLTEDIFKIENERTNLLAGDILFTSVGTLGRTCIYTGGLNLCFQRSVSIITTYINNDYLKLFLDSPYFQSKVVKEATGTAQKGFYLNQLENSIIIIPPVNEQLRIVNEIKTIFSEINDEN